MTLNAMVYAPNTPTLIGDLGVKHTETERALNEIGRSCADRIDTVIVVSPHFITSGGFGIVASERPKQLYDFYGFPDSFYLVKYDPPGNPEMGEMLIRELLKQGIPAGNATSWGLDHGAWSPLRLMFPDADKRVLPVSISPALGADSHLKLGMAIRKVSSEHDAMLLVTGSIIHRLDLYSKGTGEMPEEALKYLELAAKYMVAGSWEAIWNISHDLFIAASPEGGEYPSRVLAGSASNRMRGRIMAQELEFNAVSLTTILFSEGLR
ncbi:DODA-type extradiol aromatic ring-opening family dioxygenase [Thermoplasma acidophilum]|nr:dioxygenase [Thermoplasma acidophilum]MCY0851850.1 dioxygenase [Thermoplasma acidophilum]